MTMRTILNPPWTARIIYESSAASPPARIENSMGRRFQELAFTPRVKEHQQEHGSRRQYERMEQAAPLRDDALGAAEQDLHPAPRQLLHGLSQRDRLALRAASRRPQRLRPRNQTHLSSASRTFAATSNTSVSVIFEHDARVALFFMDYPHQTRLKILGRVEIHEHQAHVEPACSNCQLHLLRRPASERLRPSPPAAGIGNISYEGCHV